LDLNDDNKFEENKANISKNSPEHANRNDKVVIHYELQLMDGTVVDSSLSKNRPIMVVVRNLISGLEEGIQYMKIGDVFEFYITPKLGYGDSELITSTGDKVLPDDTPLIYCVKLSHISSSNMSLQ